MAVDEHCRDLGPGMEPVTINERVTLRLNHLNMFKSRVLQRIRQPLGSSGRILPMSRLCADARNAEEFD